MKEWTREINQPRDTDGSITDCWIDSIAMPSSIILKIQIKDGKEHYCILGDIELIKDIYEYS
ncbi:unnamed protein product, partial [marine sediment metagenome]